MNLPAQTRRLQHRRILASAGAGKTYELTSRYVTLLAAGVPPQSILASTFTRAAAGEIRDRVLARLADAVDHDAERATLAKLLDRPGLTPHDARELLSMLTRQIHRMQVGTLDAFFASIVHGFALELGLPAGCAIVDEVDAAALRTRAVAELLGEADATEIVGLLSRLTRGSAERSVVRAIDQTVADLYALYRQAEAGAWDWLPPVGAPLPAEVIAAAIEELEANVPHKGRRLIDAHRRDCEAARRGDWEAFVGGGVAQRVAEGGVKFSSTSIAPELVAAYRPLLDHAAAVLAERLREQTLATRELLARFDHHVRRLKQRQRLITFDDLALLAERAEARGTLDDIRFRLDAFLRHVLLDEFQDTSVPQWRGLEPLVRDVVDDETRDGSFFCVGDLKQSIYGWRDAAPDVLEQLPTLLFGPGAEDALVDDKLTTSYRAAPVLIDTINLVFETIQDNAALADDRAAAAAWQSLFVHHTTTHADRAGYVELLEVDGDDRAERQTRALDAAAELAARLHRQSPHHTIGLLTRTRKAAAGLLYRLGEHGVPASGLGGGSLTDAAAVNVVLDALTLADHPGDSAAAFHVACSPLSSVLGLEDSIATSDHAELARRIRRQLMDHGYAATIAGWIESMAAACDDRQLRRLTQLVELAELYDERGGPRPGAFISLVESKDIAEINPAPVQVLTLHKSKGLEFDIVILPELDAPLAGHGYPSVVFERDGVVGPISRVCRAVNAGVREVVPAVQPLFDEHRARTVRESLCLLYVALTRARRQLHMLAHRSKKVSTTLGGLLREALPATDGAGNEPDHLRTAHRAGDPHWLEREAPGERPRPAPHPTPIGPVQLASSTGAVRVARSPSAAARGGSIEASLRPADEDATDRGTVLHALFEQVGWLEEFRAEDADLMEVVRRSAPRRDARWKARQVEDFRAMLQQPTVRRTLRLGDRDASEWILWRERAFARLAADGLQRGRFDRVEISTALFGPDKATVLDLKTDQVDAGEATNRAEHYRPQMESYREAVAEQLGLAPDEVAAVLLFVVPDVAVGL
ncbi:MAG: UvrD-helicase domain-containing protein [Planctomycetota bacterium]|jgi:ATP-dependent exoDNAse (exonuclease V) beta subunit